MSFRIERILVQIFLWTSVIFLPILSWELDQYSFLVLKIILSMREVLKDKQNGGIEVEIILREREKNRSNYTHIEGNNFHFWI